MASGRSKGFKYGSGGGSGGSGGKKAPKLPECTPEQEATIKERASFSPRRRAQAEATGMLPKAPKCTPKTGK